MTDASSYALLGKIHYPEDLRNLPREELPALAVELRRYLIETLGRVGGHFAANLGTVELTLALHYVYNTPDDRLVWDVGHQAYPHKILTGRRTQLESIRKLGGLHPFPSRKESPYDTFGTGHSSTSLSAAMGMAVAARELGENRRVVAIIGDGGMTAGMAYEALNHIGSLGLDMLVIYNDNDMSISENVGALREHSAHIVDRNTFRAPTPAGDREIGRPRHWQLTRRQPRQQTDCHVPDGAFFESLGFTYYGLMDGHDLPGLVETLEQLRDRRGPIVLHVATVKGKGFEPAEEQPIKYHGVSGFDPVTGMMPAKKPGNAKTYTQVFSEWLCRSADREPRLIGITPAMREGSGLVEFARRFPGRYFDAAIAEQHSVTLSAGMAAGGLKPVLAIYSTFLQRAYDQLIHDVAIQELPVLFALDRGGLVGADGATHHGAFDLSYLRCIPNMVVMAPSDENECQRMLTTGLQHDGPCAVRYPRGQGPGREINWSQGALPLGKARVLRESRGRRRPRVAILAFGAMVAPALEAADIIDAAVVDMRFVKPMDETLVLEMADEHDLLVTIEDNVARGGAGSAVNELIIARHESIRVLNLGLPDHFVEHGGREELLTEVELDGSGILRRIQKRLRAKDLDQSSSAGLMS